MTKQHLAIVRPAEVATPRKDQALALIRKMQTGLPTRTDGQAAGVAETVAASVSAAAENVMRDMVGGTSMAEAEIEHRASDGSETRVKISFRTDRRSS